MSRDDTDITAVRDLPPGLPEPTDESVSRTWHRISAARRPARSRTPSRVLVPAMAALLVAGLAVGGAVVFRPADLPWTAGGPAAGKSADPNLTPAPPDAVAALNALADAAARGPAAAEVRPDQVIFVRSDGRTESVHVYRAPPAGETASKRTAQDSRLPETQGPDVELREMWFDPAEMVNLKLTDGTADLGADTAGAREDFARVGPGLRYPTAGWLAGLPSDPARLREYLRGLVPANAPWSTDHQLWDAMQEVYLRADLLMSPSVRAALLRSYTGLRGLTASEVTVKGRRLVGVRHTERGTGYEILFDPATGRAVGRRSVPTDPDARNTTLPPGDLGVDPAATYEAVWTQKVVAGVGDR